MSLAAERRHRPGRAVAAVLVSVALAATVSACGGSGPSAGSAGLGVGGLGKLTGCTGYGHSGIEGYGVESSQAFLSIVCKHEVGKVLNLGIGGSTLQGQLAQVLGLMPSTHATELSVVMWGENDLALFGPDLAGYEAGLRMLISRLRSAPGDIHTATSPALRYTGAWTEAYGEKVTTGDGSFTWTSPPGFRGGDVAFTATFRQGLGARYAFTLDGRSAGTWDTLGLAPSPPAPAVNTPGAYRIEVPAGAGHVVHCRITDVVGGADVLGWQLESAKPPLVVLVEHPRPPSFSIYDTGGWHYHPTYPQVLALDRAMRAVASEFGSYVITVDTDATIGRKRKYFLSDETHLNVHGNAIVARLIERAIARNPHVTFSR
jgi:lysophospholipase L1-like esterase